MAIDEESDDDETSDSDEDTDQEPAHFSSDFGMPISVAGDEAHENTDETAPGLGASFDAMSISPAKDGMNAAEQVLALA